MFLLGSMLQRYVTNVVLLYVAMSQIVCGQISEVSGFEPNGSYVYYLTTVSHDEISAAAKGGAEIGVPNNDTEYYIDSLNWGKGDSAKKSITEKDGHEHSLTNLCRTAYHSQLSPLTAVYYVVYRTKPCAKS